MSFKRAQTATCNVRTPSKQPEVITIPDSDGEDSQDLFDTMSDDVVLIDSDDLFSTSGSEAGSPSKKHSQSSKRLSRSQVMQYGSPLLRRYPTKKAKRSSSVIISPWKSPSPRVTWRKSISGEQVGKEDPVQITIDDEIPLKKIKKEEKPVQKQKSDPWASARMKEITRKFETRDKIMTELVKNDKDFLSIVQGGALERVQKKAKEKLVEGNVVRKQADRAKMRGVVHPSSEAYFDALELSPASKERRVNEVSRVRVVAEKMPSTPENYWEVGFPSESEQRRRGLIKEVHIPRKCVKNLFQE
ncbi:hypothetical protein RB195_003216 [Necator americanus]|uniref:DNA endonuclease activator Ctp1 C-terminal domain-containing protein n=1 Tax=Necator americanus TaxID=51031 RepID=A0ABR1DMK0_NECAM